MTPIKSCDYLKVVVFLLIAATGGFVYMYWPGVISLALPLSGKQGTTRVLAANEADTYLSISNAFSDGRYRNMMLDTAVGRDYMAAEWRPTNGLVLDPVLGGITNVPLSNGRWVPYLPFFHIVVIPVDSNTTKVNVRTVSAKIIDGKRLGFMGWHHNYQVVPPVRQEEENVLDEIQMTIRPQKENSE